eukprot:TRINITY_DN26280_c0_g2_i2.p1 TRINITY_DN26280_c0_g2~~TRINITY_DN26280_c0_g2_i2.p1  ORF type:complete len:468 (-),score=82.82 TRINITY_DN26280_c0_g2_i2:38-1441(-)
MHQFEKESGAKIDFSRGANADGNYEFRIHGSRSCVSRGKELLTDLIEEIRANDSEETLKVSELVVGRLIGNGGKNVKKLQKESGASIHIKVKASPPVVCIRGSTDAIERATELVYAMVSSFQKDGDKLVGEDVEASSSQSLEVPQSIIGRLLGTKGESVRKLEEDTGTKIDILKPIGDPTTVNITGACDSVLEVIDVIGKLMDDNPEQMDEEERHEISLDFPRSMAGKLIGTGGSVINGLKAKTGAKINITKTSNTCTVKITGSSEQVDRAKEEIEGIAEGRSAPPQPETTGDLQETAAAADDDARMDSANHKQHETSVDLPLSMTGPLIGKGGSVIRQVRARTGAKIDINKTHSTLAVKISGSSMQVDLASDEIESIVAAASAPEEPAASDDAEETRPDSDEKASGRANFMEATPKTRAQPKAQPKAQITIKPKTKTRPKPRPSQAPDLPIASSLADESGDSEYSV